MIVCACPRSSSLPLVKESPLRWLLCHVFPSQHHRAVLWRTAVVVIRVLEVGFRTGGVDRHMDRRPLVQSNMRTRQAGTSCPGIGRVYSEEVRWVHVHMDA